ncbi:rhomboid family intramembrane serine protease [Acanthopleuribacter pedis]|uniref:Rhomboid family intramembrane serine protease n=1 Tax=Acanthopleuribacter pedis TaxID=442870 RepID=A0A8J7U7V1_9BACT|nr:rhomboid family intramembrane serine protease [Acanthopleuribacter pedis]MBO1321786.1 rhomboid family intramembrane serine protease [Acanthopleuribacter pedis]
MIPVGIDQSILRRVPIVSFSLMVVWVVLQFLSNLGGSQEALHADYLDLVDTYREHRYIQISPYHEAVLEDRLFFETVHYYDVQDYLDSLSPEARKKVEAKVSYYGGATLPEIAIPEVSRQQVETASRKFAVRVDQFLRHYPAFRYGIGQRGFSAFGLLTYVFIHTNILVLIGHLVMFYFTGPLVEDRFGRPFYGAFLATAAVFTGVMLLGLHRNPYHTVVGAGGVVAAVTGAFLFKFYDVRFTFFYATRFGSGTFKVPAYLFITVLAFFFGWMAYFDRGYGSGAVWLYVWGFAFGFAIAALLKITGWDVRIDPKGLDLDLPENNPVNAVRQADADGKGDALDILARGIKDYPEMEDLRRRYWTRARETKDPVHLAAAAPWMFEHSLQHEDIGTALIVYRTCRDLVPHLRFPFDLCCYLAGTLMEIGDYDAAAEVLDQQKAILFEYSPQQRLQLALLAADWSHARALAIAEPLENNGDLDGESRETLATSLAFWRDAPDTVYAPDPNVRKPLDLSEYQQPMVFDRDTWAEELDPAQDHWQNKAHAVALVPEVDPGRPPSASGDHPAVPTQPTGPVPKVAPSPQAVPAGAPARPQPTLFRAAVQGLNKEGILLLIPGQQVRTFPFQRINGLTLALVAGHGLVLDLVFGDLEDTSAVARVIRLEPDDAAAKRLFPDVRDARTALVMLARTLHEASNAHLILGEASLKGPDLARFPSLQALEQRCYPGRVLSG